MMKSNNQNKQKLLRRSGPLSQAAGAGTGRSAFTLIELLTVIAIIGILAAILIPITAQVRESGRRAKCQSNIRQQLMGMHLFANEKDGKIDEDEAPRGTEVAGFWYVIVASRDNAPLDLYPDYVDEYEAFICPSTKNKIRPNEIDRNGRLVDLFNNSRDAEDASGGHSYEYFGVYGTREMAGVIKTPVTVEGKETFTVLVLDGDDAGLQNCPDPINNHGDAGWNWGFADGHVEWVTRAETNKTSYQSYHSGTRCPENPYSGP